MIPIVPPPLVPPDLTDQKGTADFFRSLIGYLENLRQQVATASQSAQDVDDAIAAIPDPTPTGLIKLWLVGTVPSGWLALEGGTASRTGATAALFGLWGTTFGAGDGSTTFGLPDFRDRVPIGSSGSKAAGSTGGSATATIGANHLPPHTHDMGNHTHGMDHDHTVPTDIGGADGDGGRAKETDATGTASTVTSGGSSQANTGTPSTNTTGNGGFANDALPIQNPYLAVKFIVKL